MSFIRPELLQKFRAQSHYLPALVLAGAGLLVLTMLAGWFFAALGICLVSVAIISAVNAWTRARLASDRIGLGVVEVSEREVRYLTPGQGTMISLDDLARVEAVTTDQGPWVEDLHWVLLGGDGRTVAIPNSAHGVPVLLDAFAALPGADLSPALAALSSTEAGRFTIWVRQQPAITKL